ncbi:unnamed protein product [Vicia faba]|uniref:Uncharacterized protein n=1 Tax=Vicia faba TaxID=3906 RepID=A0AAV0YLS5_VICFA|nr:unnamed protein product [Vicia faba]
MVKASDQAGLGFLIYTLSSTNSKQEKVEKAEERRKIAFTSGTEGCSGNFPVNFDEDNSRETQRPLRKLLFRLKWEVLSHWILIESVMQWRAEISQLEAADFCVMLELNLVGT